MLCVCLFLTMPDNVRLFVALKTIIGPLESGLTDDMSMLWFRFNRGSEDSCLPFLPSFGFWAWVPCMSNKLWLGPRPSWYGSPWGWLFSEPFETLYDSSWFTMWFTYNALIDWCYYLVSIYLKSRWRSLIRDLFWSTDSFLDDLEFSKAFF